MAFIVTDNCIGCKNMDCVEVCPVDCFYQGLNLLVIHPGECVDCGLCQPECRSGAIFGEEDLPKDKKRFTKINADLAKIWPVITEKEILA